MVFNSFTILSLVFGKQRIFFPLLGYCFFPQAMSWSENDNYFVSGSLKVYSVDLSSQPLKLVPEVNVNYDGPKGHDFKRLLLDNGFRVNNQGKTIVRVPKRNDEEEYNFFLMEMVVPLGPYGFTNLPSPSQEVIELKRLLEESRQEVKELNTLMAETRADLAEKNAEVDELRRNWNSDLRVGVDLKPPAKSGDPISVLGFVGKLRSLFLDKEFSAATFLGAANDILASISSIFHRRNGLSFDMVKSIPTSTPSPADLLKNLIILREFVETHFFIDGSVIVKAYGLMNERDIPAIFRDSEAGVAELHRKERGAKSIDNIDGKSIFYGYFNIPSVGKFKGVLTRVDFTLPDEIMVKLLRQPRPKFLDEARFWFVKANGDAIFEKSLSPPATASNPENMRFHSNRVLGGGVLGGSNNGVDFLRFFRRMNRTFVNKEGRYLKFEFTAIKYTNPPLYFDDEISRYVDSEYLVRHPFSRVQFDANETLPALLQGPVSFPTGWGLIYKSDDYFNWILTNRLGRDCAFVFKSFCFVGTITEDAGADFHKNALVSVFFEHSELGEDCYVDALATTFFVLNPNRTAWYTNEENVVPEFIGKS